VVKKKEHIYFNCLGNINGMTHFRALPKLQFTYSQAKLHIIQYVLAIFYPTPQI